MEKTYARVLLLLPLIVSFAPPSHAKSSFEESWWMVSLSFKILPSMVVSRNCFHGPLLNEGKTQLRSYFFFFNNPVDGYGKAEL